MATTWTPGKFYPRRPVNPLDARSLVVMMSTLLVTGLAMGVFSTRSQHPITPTGPNSADAITSGQTTPRGIVMEQKNSKQEREGHEPSSASVTVNDNETETVHATLTPTFGVLQINSFPWSDIYLDSEKKSSGATPLTLTNIPTGKHTVRFVSSVAGNRQHTVEVTVSKNQATTVSHIFP